MNSGRSVDFIKGIAIISGLALLDRFVFATWFHTGHVAWYLKNGAVIGLVTSVASMAWGDANKNVGLISAHPMTYFGSCLQMVGLPILVLGTHMRSNKDGSAQRSLLDTLITIPFVLVLCAFMVLWLIVVAPLQYFVCLLCGAPARLMSQSNRRTIAQMNGGILETAEIGKGDKLPDGGWDASISAKPVAITNLFSALFFIGWKAFFG